jgi:eukaryotic-like serine/threonine-protein kinase
MPVENLNAAMQTIGNYDLVEKIAEGGMGTVYRGRNRLTGDVVAVKVVPQHLLSNPVVLKRFELEYNVARQINHPNIVKALDFGQDATTHFLVMEFVEGESLGQKIERDGKMDETESIRIIAQVAEALHKAHKKGLIHRDVKPDNVLLTPEGLAKLTDLGLVKELEADNNLTRTGRGLGTPHFMAPEQFRNAKKADARCDIYSLAATLYMMVTGELPFKSTGPLDAWMKKNNNEIDAPRKLNPEVSERVDWAIRRALSSEPMHRPESCREFVEDLTGHSTKKLSSTEAGIERPADFWYMVYTDEGGVVHTVKGAAASIRRSLKDGLLGDAEQIRVARTKAGPFESMRHFPEFRDLVLQPSNTPTVQIPVLDARRFEARPRTPDAVDIPATAPNDAELPTPQSAKRPEASGPRINLKMKDSSLATDWWKWSLYTTMLSGGGVLLFIFHRDLWRYARWMFGGFG